MELGRFQTTSEFAVRTELGAVTRLAALRPATWLLAACLASSWLGLRTLEGILGWGASRASLASQATGLAWMGAMASVFGLCLLARPLEPIRLAMSPRGSLRAVAASALLASVSGALLVLLPALAMSGALLEVRGIGLGAGIVTVQVAGLGLAAWATTRNPTRQPMVFLAMAWLVPSCLGEQIGPLVSGAWVATPAGMAPLAALGGVALVWGVAIAAAPVIRTEGLGDGGSRERHGAAR